MSDVNFATLAVNLAAIRENYRLLKDLHAKKAIAAVVKANAYGLGVDAVAKALWDEGCMMFFVATLEEGVQLRSILPAATIAVFHGIQMAEEKEFIQHRLTPVINHLGQAERITGEFQKTGVILHVDTGITRLGFSAGELAKFANTGAMKHVSLVMSHLACASEPQHAKNAEQLLRFKAVLASFPQIRASLANSSGLFLPQDYHFDLGRPGCGLYGIHPYGTENPLKHVATLSAPILQLRTLEQNETVGYGATFAAKKGDRIAIVGLGYADGYFRQLGNKAHAYVRGYKVPLIGRVSMDMVALDMNNVPEMMLTQGTRAEFINEQINVNELAEQAGTIGYEIFTRIGRRVQRVYA